MRTAASPAAHLPSTKEPAAHPSAPPLNLPRPPPLPLLPLVLLLLLCWASHLKAPTCRLSRERLWYSIGPQVRSILVGGRGHTWGGGGGGSAAEGETRYDCVCGAQREGRRERGTSCLQPTGGVAVGGCMRVPAAAAQLQSTFRMRIKMQLPTPCLASTLLHGKACCTTDS